MWSNTDMKPVKTFWENDQRPEFVIIFGSKWLQNLASEAHIPHTTENTSNEHVKQYWCKTSENVLRKWLKSKILTYFGVQNGSQIGPFRPILYTSLEVAQVSI